MEEWRDIPKYEGFYQVSDRGRVRNVRTGRILKPGASHNGYYMVRLSRDNYALTQRINRLVAAAFVPNPRGLPQVNHKNGIKTDNRAENLEWCTASYNQRHRYQVLGQPAENRKSVLCIETGQVYPSLTAAAQSLGLHIGNLSKVCAGKRAHTQNLHFKFKEDKRMSTKVVTGKVRFSFCNIFTPREDQNGGEPKYSVTLLIPKSDTTTVGRIKAAMAEARENFVKKNGASSLPANPSHTMHDGDGLRPSGDPFGPECKGCYVITVSSKNKPAIVDKDRNEILDPAEVYSGCFGRASINFYGYNRSGKKGISAGLLAIQKLADGEPFGTVGSASDFDDDFMEVEDDDGFML